MSATIPRTFPTWCIERVLAAIESGTGHPFSIHSVAPLDGRIDEKRLAESVRKVLEAEPAFRCTFTQGWFQPYWKLEDGLRQTDSFELVSADDEAEELQRIVGSNPGVQSGFKVKVFLIRTQNDTLCVKLNHKIGDGQTCKQFLYRLAETYTRIAADPKYVPPLQLHPDRSVMQVTRSLSESNQKKVLNEAKSKVVDHARPAQWRLPVAKGAEEASSHYCVQQIDPARRAAIARYAGAQSVSQNTVLLAAFARAALKILPRSGDAAPEIMQTVDLRRYLDCKDQPYHCNLSSMITLKVEPAAADPLAKFVASFGAQMGTARKNFMGLTHPLVRWELNSRRRFLFNCIPFRVLKRATRRKLRRLAQDGFPSRVVFSNVGPYDLDLLRFGNVAATQAYPVTSVFMDRELFLLLVSECAGTLYLIWTYSPRFIDGSVLQSVIEEMQRSLPA